MSSKRSHEGYILIDNRHAPDLYGHRGVYESATLTCSHCQAVMLLNPLRTREREWCFRCDHYICDSCGLMKKQGAECMTMNEIIDRFQTIALRGALRGGN